MDAGKQSKQELRAHNPGLIKVILFLERFEFSSEIFCEESILQLKNNNNVMNISDNC